jgi:hypothetical protein
MIISILNISLSGSLIEDKVKSFEEHMIKANPNILLKDLKLIFKKDLGDGWSGYIYALDLTLQGKQLNVKDIIFSNGKMVSKSLKNINGLDLKRLMHPILGDKYTHPSHLIAGNIDAKHKLVVFSDPLCPLCIEDTPRIIADVKAHPKKLSLYYISFPLQMHPTAKTLVKAGQIAHDNGIKNVKTKLYKAGFDFYFDPYKNRDHKKALKAFNIVFKTKITMDEIENKKINDRLESDIRLGEEAFINGTPSLFIDGKIDLLRNGYKKFY